MAVAAGTRLGCYEILSLLGRGGMGEVYRARDTRLGREVAIKILPEPFVADPDRVARFEREAQALAALNHPNIAGIYGIEESSGIKAFVLELVDGPTLAERSASGPVPAAEALELAKQIANALEAAHGKGIVHRDLKPANIKLTLDGRVKVLDFGLAKFALGDAGRPVSEATNSPTMTVSGTRDGVLLGTAAYMSPEQTRGQVVDKQADVWAFGCVLYQMLTGRQAFPGGTVSDTIAAILDREPDWSALPVSTSRSVRRVLARCLKKDLRHRFRDMGDVLIELDDDELSIGSLVDSRSSDRPSRSTAVAWILGLAALAVVSGVVLTLRTRVQPVASPGRSTARFATLLEPPLASQYDAPVALSPDGTRLVYIGTPDRGSTRQLYSREFGDLSVKPIAGTAGALAPFFSPDGRWVGFWADLKLRKVAIAGGPPQTVCDARALIGASWGPDNTIVFAPTSNSGLWRVSADGGTPTPITTPDPQRREGAHRWPQFLPGGRALLFVAGQGGATFSTPREGEVVVQSTEGGTRKVIARGSFARYLRDGHLVYLRGNTLMAAAFDLNRLELIGPAAPVLDGLNDTIAVPLAISETGSLAYVPPGNPRAGDALVWIDREGRETPLSTPSRNYLSPRIAPNGQQAAVVSDRRIWLSDLSRGIITPLTGDDVLSSFPVWTPDGRRLAFLSNQEGPINLFWMPADGSRPAERLAVSQNAQFPFSFSPDGRQLFFVDIHPITSQDIWVLTLDGDRKARPVLNTRFVEAAPAVSPDGQWLAYVSNESGGTDVYVRSTSGSGGKWRVSSDGGAEIAWSPSGRELFYRNGNRMIAVDVETQPTFSLGKPHVLFDRPLAQGNPWRNYDVSRDGRRFLMVKSSQEEPFTQLNVVLDWTEDLKQRVPAK